MSLDMKRPTGRRARKIHQARAPIKEFRCLFCGAASTIQEWAEKQDTCPKCGLMHVEDDGLGVGWGT